MVDCAVIKVGPLVALSLLDQLEILPTLLSKLPSTGKSAI